MSTYPTSVSATSCSTCSQHHECRQNNLEKKHRLNWCAALLLGWFLNSKSLGIIFLKCKSPSDSSLGVPPAWMLVLLKSYWEINVGLQLELSGKLLVHYFWLLKLYCFFQGIKRLSTVLLGVFVWKKCVSFEKISAQKRYIAGLRIMSV